MYKYMSRHTEYFGDETKYSVWTNMNEILYVIRIHNNSYLYKKSEGYINGAVKIYLYSGSIFADNYKLSKHKLRVFVNNDNYVKNPDETETDVKDKTTGFVEITKYKFSIEQMSKPCVLIMACACLHMHNELIDANIKVVVFYMNNLDNLFKKNEINYSYVMFEYLCCIKEMETIVFYNDDKHRAALNRQNIRMEKIEGKPTYKNISSMCAKILLFEIIVFTDDDNTYNAYANSVNVITRKIKYASINVSNFTNDTRYRAKAVGKLEHHNKIPTCIIIDVNNISEFKEFVGCLIKDIVNFSIIVLCDDINPDNKMVITGTSDVNIILYRDRNKRLVI